jgi:ribosome-interacting GTPase 1
MPINVNDPEYTKAEKEYLEAKTPDERLEALNRMISHAPKHKGAENLRQQLTQRRKRLEEEAERKKKKSKGGKGGIKKGEMQVLIIGKTNSGKSSLMKSLTNTTPKISPVPFTTKEPLVGVMDYESSQIQIIEIPAIEGEDFEKGIIHTADAMVLLADKIEDIDYIREKLPPHGGKEIIAVNKSDLMTEEEKRKLHARMQSKKYNFAVISSLPYTKDNGREELKKKIFDSFDILRVFTKEPGNEKKEKPIILQPGSSVKDAAEKIFKGFSGKIIETKIWGPSSKFGGQIVGLNHKLEDRDTIEFKTK